MQFAVQMLAFAALILGIFSTTHGFDVVRAKRESNSAPYLASVRFMGHHRCSGAVVGDSFVITAAQCVQVDDLDFLEVAVGPNLNTVYQVSGVSVHPLYDSLNEDYDIAVIETKTPMLSSDSVSPIQVAEDPMNSPRSNTPSSSVAWDNGKNEVVSQEAIPVPEREVSAPHGLSSRMLFAEVNSLPTDVGAPLVRDGHLVGVLTAGVGARRVQSEVAVYTRAHPYTHQLLAERKLSGETMRKLCAALKVIIKALKNMRFVPRIVRSAVTYIHDAVGCP